MERNSRFFDQEIEKLDKWTEDRKGTLELELKELDIEIKTRKTEAKKILRLEEKVAAQRAGSWSWKPKVRILNRTGPKESFWMSGSKPLINMEGLGSGNGRFHTVPATLRK